MTRIGKKNAAPRVGHGTADADAAKTHADRKARASRRGDGGGTPPPRPPHPPIAVSAAISATTPVRLYSVEVYDAASGSIAGGEIGYTVGRVYSSLTGFSGPVR